VANTAQARKRVRQANKRREHNKARGSMMRSAIKKVVNAIANKDKEAAVSAYNDMVPVIDVAAKNGILHRNKAARHKSRLNKHIKAL